MPDLGAAGDAGTTLTLSVPDRRATEEVVTALGEVLGRHSGDNEVRMHLTRDGVARVFELRQRVRVTADLYGELKTLLGPGCLV